MTPALSTFTGHDMKAIEHNIQTGETIERDLTAEEIAQREQWQAEAVAQRAAEMQAKEKRDSVLAALAAAAGLEVDEVKAALGA